MVNSCLLHQPRTMRILMSFLCVPVCLDGFYLSPIVRDCRQRNTVNVQMAKRVSEEATRRTTMATALCIIPPDEAWDTIQRARHMARDRTYQKWPPAIRLFHPFCAQDQLSDRALEIAHIIEEYNIEPFQITLGSWTIVPHMEAIEADWEAMKQLPVQEKVITKEVEETEADRLIAEEERLGRERLLKRAQRSRQKRQAAGMPVTETASEIIAREEDEAKSRKKASNDLLEKQKQQYEEFNGPCVLCLEPDEESGERITQLRELLRTELFEEFAKFSPSSSVSTSRTLPRAVLEAEEANISFRPIVPVGNFPTVTSAVEMARKLKSLWDPLSFNVTDFQFISCEDEDSPSENHSDEFSVNPENNLKQITSWRLVDVEEEVLTSQGQYGCDAQVMLMGEEIDTDDESSKEMVDFIMNQGSPGGFQLKEGGSIDDEPHIPFVLEESDQETNDDTEDLELWLNGDDEWDEGTVIVIGRTHFFSGDMRSYEGMPATNTMDAKDRVFGEGTSALARRKGSG